MAGISQVFYNIYAPVWADAFGSERQKSLWITLYFSCGPLGIFIGFSFASLMNDPRQWEEAFLIQSILIIPCLFFLILTDPKWYNVADCISFKNECQKKVLKRMNLPEDFLEEK